LAKHPQGRHAANDRAGIAAAERELARRQGEGDPPEPVQAIQRGTTQAAIQALGSASGDAAAVTAKLAALAANFHMVSPASHVDVLPPGCGVSMSYVTVNPDDSKEGPGEVYSVGGGKVGLSAVTLSKIAAAAGVSWDANKSGRLDDGHDRHYCRYLAVGVVKSFDGSERVLTGEVEIDAREGSPQIDEIRSKARDRTDKGAAQILELRKYLLRHAERKAKSRAIADLGVKRSYHKRELAKPFAVARLMFTGQTEDPLLRQVFALKTAEAFLGASSALYGPPRVPPALLLAHRHEPQEDQQQPEQQARQHVGHEHAPSDGVADQ
jgi:hypothetical protein